MIDTGSDLCLMRADCYNALDAPTLRRNKIYFRGIGSVDNKILGEFDANICIDDNVYRIKIRVVSNVLMRHDFIIGADFLRAVEVVMRNGELSILKPRDPELPEIFQINYVCKAGELDMIHLNDGHRDALERMIQDYKPNKVRDVNIKMKLILKDDEPVYQRARRLSEQEKQVVKWQIDEWMREGIIRPSLSEYASPVVLVRKKNGAYRLCVDYRRLNQKIVKDRYPLPLIEDQLSRLQNAKIFTTLDLDNIMTITKQV